MRRVHRLHRAELSQPVPARIPSVRAEQAPRWPDVILRPSWGRYIPAAAPPRRVVQDIEPGAHKNRRAG